MMRVVRGVVIARSDGMTAFDKAWGVSKLDGEGRCVCNTQLFHPGEFLDNECDDCGKPIFPGKEVMLRDPLWLTEENTSARDD